MQISPQQIVTGFTDLQRLAASNKGSIIFVGADYASVGQGSATRRKPSLKTITPIHPSSLGGFTIEGPFYRRPSRFARALDRFFYWLGA